jgi:catechol 2,3-dioxygenase-like lactoylglutathione lyase family enzyme
MKQPEIRRSNAEGVMGPDVRLAIVILAVCDLPRTVSFYRAAFEWEQTVDEHVYAEFQMSSNQRLGLYQREGFGRRAGKVPKPIPEGELAGAELYFLTDDLAGAMERLETAGARHLSALQIRPWGDEAAYYADPDGTVLVIARTVQSS